MFVGAPVPKGIEKGKTFPSPAMNATQCPIEGVRNRHLLVAEKRGRQARVENFPDATVPNRTGSQ
jgi:hypothetical protein